MGSRLTSGISNLFQRPTGETRPLSQRVLTAAGLGLGSVALAASLLPGAHVAEESGSGSPAVSVGQGELRVADPYHYQGELFENPRVVSDFAHVLTGPGRGLNLFNQHHDIGALRDDFEPVTTRTYASGVAVQRGGGMTFDAVPNPDSPTGEWNPYEFLPRFSFDRREDAFPVSPAFDHDATTLDNAPAKANGTDGNYRDGVIGGDQALAASFNVSQKDAYTVLTYGLYFADNKAMIYHRNDYATVQVYLAKGKSGKLEPQYLYSSFHHGGTLSKWSDLAKDSAGHPEISVTRGGHALLPVKAGHGLPRTRGIQLDGAGEATLAGHPLEGQQLGFDTFQGNVAQSTRVTPDSAEGSTRLGILDWDGVALDPLPPSAFDAGKPAVTEPPHLARK